MNNLYIVTMYRWGSRENHSYVLGVYDDKELALKSAIENQIDRGGKYYPEILEFNLNITGKYVTTLPLEE